MSALRPMLAAAASAQRLRASLLTAIVVCLSCAGLAASLTVRASAGDRLDSAFHDADAAELVAYVAPEAATSISELDQPQVVEVGEPVPSIDTELIVDGERVPIELRGEQGGDNGFNAPVLTDGRLPTAADEGLLDAAFADETALDVGDAVAVVADGATTELVVVGLGYDFSDCLYPTCDPPHLWVAGAATTALGLDRAEASMVAIDLADTSAIPEVVDALRQRLGADLLGWNDWSDSRADMLVETDFFGAFLAAFGLFVLVSSAIVIASAIGARTIARRRAIGLYKTLGYSPRQITAALLIEHLGIAVVACLVGNAVAAMLAPRMRFGSMRIIGGDGASMSPSTVLASSSIVILIVVVATLAPAWRAGRIEVTAALVDAPPTRRRPRTAPLPGRLSLTAGLAWSAITARPLRAFFGVAAVAIAIVVAVVSISIDRSVDRVVSNQALAGDPADVALEAPDDTGATSTERILDELDSAAAWYSVADDMADVDGTDVHVRAIGGEYSTRGFVIGEGRGIEHPGEAIAGFGLMDAMGWQVGDRVGVGLPGHQLELELVGWYRETEDSGRILQVHMDDYRRAHPDVQPSYAVIATETTTPDELAADLATAFGERAGITVRDSDGSDLTPFRVAMAVMTLLIAAVAAAHLLASVLTSSRERARRFAIQRSIGFDNRRLALEAACHGLVVAALALLVGLPLGWWAQGAIGDLLTSELGAGPGLAVAPTPTQYVTIALTTATVVAASTLVATRPTLKTTNA